jgi:hypothetical protein
MTPGAAVQLDNERERPCAARLEETSQQRLVSVTDILDVFNVEFISGKRFGFHDSPPRKAKRFIVLRPEPATTRC